MITRRRWASAAVATLALALALPLAGCAKEDPPRQYILKGQILVVKPETQELTIKHEDIPNFMPAMTMTYPVASKTLMAGREAGEVISATLEVRNATGRLTAIQHTGAAPLPSSTNEVALASGLLAVGDAVPDAAFLDQDNRRRAFSEWTGTITLLTFIYLDCPDTSFCPLMDQHFAAIQKQIGDDQALKGRVKLVSMSFDPEADTPKRLAAHAATRHADPAIWTFLTGDRVTVHRFAARFGISLIRPEGMTEINHNLRTVLIGADGHVLKIYPGNEWTPAGVLADIRAVRASS